MKKSLSQKLNKFRTSPLIIGVAILEVIVLLCMCTYAWFVFSDNNTVSTDIISVEPDSGLQIDFNDAAENDYVNIWNYLKEFQFEPVTSLDGRNIFIPTTGTFNATDTANMKFREATVNDMNSKYINIDFTLTNTGEEAMPVYLSSKSYFKLYDPDTKTEVNSKAIRIAFYQNDGSSGKITSSLLSKDYEGEDPDDSDDSDDSGDTQSTYLVYFDKTGSDWTDVWIEADFTVEIGTNRRLQMEPISEGSNIYYIDLKKILDDHGSTNFTFMKFHNSTSDNGNEYMSVQLPAGQINSNTMYSFELDSNNEAYVGNLNGHNGLMLNDPVPYTGEVPDVGGDDEGDSGTTEGDTTESEERTTVYFYNSLGWEQPYAYIWQENSSGDVELSAWPGKPMTHISGAIYYYTFNSKYDSIIFNDGNSQGGAVKTGDIYPVEDGHIYMIGSPTADNTYGWELEDYVGSVDGGTYPVISPGVSTGFQRPYAPVTQIDDNSGKSKVVIPAFASSIDDYNFGSGNPLFTIEPGQTLPLSMIIWLEGTDPDCTEDVYAGKSIDMNLVFATKDSGEKMYTYRFLDKTKENWIDDRITTDTGVSFKPVIQLYDVDNHKGYHMTVHDDENGNPTIWQCQAPEELIESKHIMFRRVNPMNEDEVWNYWDTNGFGDYASDAVADSVVTFSAFADGSPTTALNENGTSYTGAPEKSCGGLWGDHETQLVTVYDGTNGQWIKNSEKEGTTSVLTMNFTYNGQNVEYKASSAYDKGMHYFIVPMNVYSKSNTGRPPITFKRYFNFDSKYALNSDRNQLTYHMSWDAGVCNGQFFEITEDDSGNKFSYWGSDILYVQAKNITKSKFDDAFMQVHYYSTSDSSTDGTNDFYSYIYKNSAFAPSDGGYGYVSVIPSDRRYYSYRVERCDPTNHSTKWDVTPAQTISYATTTDTSHSNTIGKNICAIENFQITVFLQLSTSFCWSGNDPQCYAWDDNGTHGNNSSDFSKAPTMTWYANQPSGYQQYSYVLDISRYNAVIFHNQQYANNYKTQDFKGLGGVNKDRNGMIFQSSSSQSNYVEQLLNSGSPVIMSGYKDNETMNAVLYDATGWDINGS